MLLLRKVSNAPLETIFKTFLSLHILLVGIIPNNNVIKVWFCVTSAVASAPTNLTVVQEGPISIRVSWIPPSPLGDTTGYRIDYNSDSDGGGKNFSGGSTNNYLLTVLQEGNTYTITIVGTSQHLPSSEPVSISIQLALGQYLNIVTLVT